jgi:hypothetical protein
VFALDLMSAYEGEHTIFGFLGQANHTQNDVLQFHPFIRLFFYIGSGTFLRRTALDSDPPNLNLLSSWDFRHELLCLT